MANFIYNLNSAIKTDATLISLSGKASLEIEPGTGNRSTAPPIILYWWYPGIKSPGEHYINKDIIRYSILDPDAAKVISMAQRIIALVNRTANIRTVASTDATGKWAYLANSNFVGQVHQKEGFYRIDLNFEVAWTPNA